MIKSICLAALLALFGTAHAQMSGGSSSSGSSYSSGSMSSTVEAKASAHNFSVLGSMNRGGFAIGAAYEYMFDGATGVGGHIRTFPKETGSPTTSAVRGLGLMIFGAQMGHHFYKKRWDLAFTPSFNIISIDSIYTQPDDTTTMGPGMSISLLWQLTDRIALGFDYSNYWVWLEDDFAGLVISDMAVKMKAGF